MPTAELPQRRDKLIGLLSEKYAARLKTMPRNKRNKEIVFDPEERRKYLRGFSDRKKQRRAFGLAMQKVKDRKAKLEDRREQRKEELERVEEAEQQKRTLLEEALGRAAEVDDNAEAAAVSQSQTALYSDQATAQQWGGQVIVTTTIANLSDDESDEEEQPKKKKAIDLQQRYAGNVDKYMTKLQANMPKKKSSSGNRATKGNHGAANMKGIGGASNLKMAKKALTKVQGKTAVAETGKRKKKRRR